MFFSLFLAADEIIQTEKLVENKNKTQQTRKSELT